METSFSPADSILKCRVASLLGSGINGNVTIVYSAIKSFYSVASLLGSGINGNDLFRVLEGAALWMSLPY